MSVRVGLRTVLSARVRDTRQSYQRNGDGRARNVRVQRTFAYSRWP